MIPSGIEPATFRLAAQNQLHHRVPLLKNGVSQIKGVYITFADVLVNPAAPNI
jgi:hypothetical protein